MIVRTNRDAWFVTIGAILFSLGLIVFSYERPPRIGDVIPISITVIPSDSNALDCSGDVRFGVVRCNYDAEGRPQSAQNPLRPYMTVRNEMFILTGVFEDPSVGQWVRKARQTRNNARVRINCQAALLESSVSITVRFRKVDAWRMVKGVPVARVRHCQVVP